MIRYRLIEEHLKSVKSGNFELGREILYLLRKHHIKVGLDDVGCELEMISEKCGCRIRYGRNYNIATIEF